MKISKLGLGSLVALALLQAPASAQVVAKRPSYTHGRSLTLSPGSWIPGRFETVLQRVWVPGWSERQWVEPVFEWRLGPCGTRIRVLVCAGRWKTVHHPGHYEVRSVRVWQPGSWVSRACE